MKQHRDQIREQEIHFIMTYFLSKILHHADYCDVKLKL